MKSLFDRLTTQQCADHGSPYSFIYNSEIENETRMICDECINPQTENGKLISIRKTFKFLEQKLLQKNQSRLQLTSLWQQFKHNSVQILGLLKYLEDLMDHLLNSINNKLETRTLNDEFLTQPSIQIVGQSLGSQIKQDSYGQFQLKQEQEVGQQEQNWIFQCNNILAEQQQINDDLNCLINSLNEQHNNIKQTKNQDIKSVDITNKTYQTNQTIKVKAECNWICLSSNERQMVAAVGQQINLFKLSYQGEWIEEQFQLVGHTRLVYQVKFNHNSTLIASCGLDNQIIIWKKQFNGQWSINNKQNGNHDYVWSICFNHDSSLLASVSDNGTIQIHHFMYGKLRLQQQITGHNRFVYDVCFNYNSTKLASGSSDMSIVIWELNKLGQWVVFQKLEEQIHNVCSLQFNSKSNQLISSSYDQTIKIWEVNSQNKSGQWKLIHTLTGHSSSVRSAYFNKKSNTIVSGSYDKSIMIWNINQEGKWKCTQTINQHQNLINCTVISSDSTMIISGSSDCTINIYKLKATR